ncbi:DUF4105 domain-containing protein [Pedobacter sp. JY14-1]|uniref:lipoprotein N-acyltransferase Lnb domain-containing protein n=1 Tax=Pedobacter sp. JY14-1 TaxID=3034151 RepID=UPI0023E12977|nr:DUF4105 domain-containing protein [Pedobacter sp. JY14-1]
MKTFKLSLFILWLCPIFCYCQHYNVKKASIIYCGLGNEIYSIFGHVGIRITNGVSDRVYNFGTFDASTPQFISKYIKGNLDYALSIEDYDQFILSYEAEGREVKEFQLLLTENEVYDLEAKLHNIYNSSSRFYRYQFLQNNCSTKISELLKRILGDQIIQPDYELNSTYRQSLNETMRFNSVWRFPVNCLLGATGEKKLSIASNYYLPDSLINTLSHTKLSNSKESSILGNPTSILPPKNELKTWHIDYIVVLSVLIFVVLYKSRYLLVFTSVLGIVIVFLMLYSNREEFSYNYNILIFNPFDLVLFIPRSPKKSILFCSVLLNIGYVCVFIILSITYLPLILLAVGLIYVKAKTLYGIHRQNNSHIWLQLML